MKRIFTLFLSAVLIVSVIMSFPVSSYASYYGDFRYYIINGFAEIDYYNGNDEELVIPGYIEGYPVVLGSNSIHAKNAKTITLEE